MGAIDIPAMLTQLDELADEVAVRLGDSRRDVATMFRRTVRNTLETTITVLDDGTVHVITGDIPAMWLRDSSAQVRPYVALSAGSPDFANLLVGVSRRQFLYIAHDSYANAFNPGPTGDHWNDADQTDMSDWVWERKFELDSLCYPIFLAHEIRLVSGRVDHLDDVFLSAARAIIETWRVESEHDGLSSYSFYREGEGLDRDGRGTPVRNAGLVWSGFRPSDDACRYHFNIPGNIHTALAAERLADLLDDLDPDLAGRARDRAVRIREAIAEHAIVPSPSGGYYAYEVDGYGDSVTMDDANIPSLLSLPYLGWCAPDDPVYVETRAVVLSARNPYYYSGSAVAGVGSPHLGSAPYVWPLAMAMRGLTSSDAAERDSILADLVATDGGTGLIHEGVNADDPTDFTRPWFAWGNALFSELVLAQVGLMPFGYGATYQTDPVGASLE